MPPSKSPPKIVPIIKIEQVGHFIFPGCEIAIENTEEELHGEYYKQIHACGHAIFAPQFIDDQEKRPKAFPFGTLARVVAVKKHAPDPRIEFEGLMRVRYKLADGRIEQKVAMGRWTKIIDEPVAPEIFRLPDLHSALEHLKQVFNDLIARVINEEIFKQKFVRKTMSAVKNLGENVNQGALTSLLYDIMNMVPYVDIEGEKPIDLLRPSFMIFQQTNLLERLASVTMLLDILIHPPTIVGATETHSAGESTPSRPRGNATYPLSAEDLIKILFHDDLAVLQETTSEPEEELTVPEADEPPSITRMREFISSRIIGQDRPIRTIARAFNLAKAGLLPEERPLLVVFFAGPTSVGKTEMAHALSDFIQIREKEALKRAKQEEIEPPFTERELERPPLIEVDCGMFAGSLSHGISNLIGSPVGFVGSKGVGQNAQRPILCKENFPPNRITILLFDEIEKAFIDSRDNGAELKGILMKILDKGRFMNNWNEEVDFTRTVIIFTSNIGAREIIKSATGPEIGFEMPGRDGKRKQYSEDDVARLNEKIYEVTKREYGKLFPPDFRNRIHRFLAFHFFTAADYRAIIIKEFLVVREKARKKLSIDLELADETVAWLVGEIRAEEGVRKLRDFMAKEISEPLARAHNLGRLHKGKLYEVYVKRTSSTNGRNSRKKKTENGESGQICFRIKESMPQSS